MSKYDNCTLKISQLVTTTYSTSFSYATSLMNAKNKEAIYSIYGFVRLADEIVDTFHEHNKAFLLNKFEEDFNSALENKLSLNPILHSFQLTVNQYKIPLEYVDAFLASMEADLEKKEYKTKLEADQYIYGSADVVGLMCLKVFCYGDESKFQQLKAPAMRLGSAFQKVNFLRDLKNDVEILGRNYFPDVDYKNFNESSKQKIVAEIEDDFAEAYQGIKELPKDVQLAVLVAYLYYKKLLKKIARKPAHKIQESRIRISNFRKTILIAQAIIKNKLKIV